MPLWWRKQESPEERDRECRQSSQGQFPTIESWGDRDAKVQVSQREGFACKVGLRARIDMAPSALYDLLTEEDNTRYFRNLKAIRARKVLEDDGQGRQVVEVEHEAQWRFLLFSGTLNTLLHVHQNRNLGQVTFRLARTNGLMKRFEGTWEVRPFTQQTLDEMSGFEPEASRSQPIWLRAPGNFVAGIHRRLKPKGDDASASLVTLEQSVLPNKSPPPPLDYILKGVASRQVRNLLEDIRAEADRRKAEEERNKPHPSTSGAPLV